MQDTLYFFHILFAGVIAQFAPVNPIGTALVVEPMLADVKGRERHRVAAKISFYCFALCVGVILVGSWFFKAFGVSLPVVQLAGGLVICHMGWQLLGSDESPSDAQASPQQSHKGDIEDKLFYPIAFPMTTGPGSISVLLTLSADAHSGSEPTMVEYFTNVMALTLAVGIICLMVYVSYAYAPRFLKRVGARGAMIMNRLSAFLVFCVGLQIAVSGIMHLLGRP